MKSREEKMKVGITCDLELEVKLNQKHGMPNLGIVLMGIPAGGLCGFDGAETCKLGQLLDRVNERK
jgi:hypothetical protein